MDEEVGEEDGEEDDDEDGEVDEEAQWAVRGGLGIFQTFWVWVSNGLLACWGSGI